jgi:hypothetical protein
VNNFEIGDTVWYETGFHTASRARIVGVEGRGATKTYIVHFIDYSSDQDNGSGYNRDHYKDGGIPVSWRKCKAIDYVGNEK